jgi:regulator of cell morphogenesis and NO signaling
MTATPATPIGDVVASDYQTAAVFERHGLDFCCGGRRTIEQACRAAGVDTAGLIREIDAVLNGRAPDAPSFASWSARRLVVYIVDHHHAFVRGALAPMLQYSGRIATVHGQRHPELIRLAAIVARVADEMTDHMQKEERILFPFIAALEAAAETGGAVVAAPFGAVANPIHAMEAEHQVVGDAMAEIRELTSGYQPPADACTTYRVAFSELEAFERDLHAHVHLENNILFPRAIAMQTAARA